MPSLIILTDTPAIQIDYPFSTEYINEIAKKFKLDPNDENAERKRFVMAYAIALSQLDITRDREAYAINCEHYIRLTRDLVKQLNAEERESLLIELANPFPIYASPLLNLKHVVQRIVQVDEKDPSERIAIATKHIEKIENALIEFHEDPEEGGDFLYKALVESMMIAPLASILIEENAKKPLNETVIGSHIWPLLYDFEKSDADKKAFEADPLGFLQLKVKLLENLIPPCIFQKNSLPTQLQGYISDHINYLQEKLLDNSDLKNGSRRDQMLFFSLKAKLTKFQKAFPSGDIDLQYVNFDDLFEPAGFEDPLDNTGTSLLPFEAYNMLNEDIKLLSETERKQRISEIGKLVIAGYTEGADEQLLIFARHVFESDWLPTSYKAIKYFFENAPLEVFTNWINDTENFPNCEKLSSLKKLTSNETVTTIVQDYFSNNDEVPLVAKRYFLRSGNLHKAAFALIPAADFIDPSGPYQHLDLTQEDRNKVFSQLVKLAIMENGTPDNIEFLINFLAEEAPDKFKEFIDNEISLDKVCNLILSSFKEKHGNLTSELMIQCSAKIEEFLKTKSTDQASESSNLKKVASNIPNYKDLETYFNQHMKDLPEKVEGLVQSCLWQGWNSYQALCRLLKEDFYQDSLCGLKDLNPRLPATQIVVAYNINPLRKLKEIYEGNNNTLKRKLVANLNIIGDASVKLQSLFAEEISSEDTYVEYADPDLAHISIHNIYNALKKEGIDCKKTLIGMPPMSFAQLHQTAVALGTCNDFQTGTFRTTIERDDLGIFVMCETAKGTETQGSILRYGEIRVVCASPVMICSDGAFLVNSLAFNRNLKSIEESAQIADKFLKAYCSGKIPLLNGGTSMVLGGNLELKYGRDFPMHPALDEIFKSINCEMSFPEEIPLDKWDTNSAQCKLKLRKQVK